jgi:hypothetical protein
MFKMFILHVQAKLMKLIALTPDNFLGQRESAGLYFTAWVNAYCFMALHPGTPYPKTPLCLI